MPNTKSAKKRWRQSLERRARNRAGRSALKTEIRKFRETIHSGDASKGSEQLRIVSKRLDQAAAKGVIHANAAARLKSRLSAGLKASKTAPQAAK